MGVNVGGVDALFQQNLHFRYSATEFCVELVLHLREMLSYARPSESCHSYERSQRSR